MNATSTPQRTDLRRRSLLRNTPTVLSTPLRRSNAGVPNSLASALEPADDEEERSHRRSMVAMQRRLTNIPGGSSSSPLVDLNPAIEDSQIKEMLRNYAELNAQNRISQKNAWQVHVIDVMRRMVLTDNTNVLQVAGSSLDIGAKVYSLRVDDVHARGLQLASSMAKSNENKQQVEGGEGDSAETSIIQEQRRRNVRKKNKKMAEDKRNTIDKEEKTLYGSIKHIESMVFATKENIDAGATDNLFTSRLPANPSNHQLMLLNRDKYWTNDPDWALDNGDKLLDIELPLVSHYNICSSFKDFEIGNWDPEEEERLLAEAPNFPEAILDENGIPVAELDGSVHDIFDDNNDIPDEATSDVEEQHDDFRAQIHGEIAHIVDVIPEENRIETDYSYNTLVMTSSGKYIDRIWAGPSHWKVKFNRRSSARYSGATIEQVAKQTRRPKVPQPINFSNPGPDLSETVGKFVAKRAPPTTTFEKSTLPVPDLLFQNFHKITNDLLMKPGVPRPRFKIGQQGPPDCEVQVYNYENPNDSQYCSQNNSDDANNDEPLSHSFEEEMPPPTQEQFVDENLVNAPDLVSATYIPYAMQAKKMDMKKLKAAVWKTITPGSGENDKDHPTVKPTKFSELYQTLPQLLTSEMRKELTCSLALVALLHLCNENNLFLWQNTNDNDFTITSKTLVEDN